MAVGRAGSPTGDTRTAASWTAPSFTQEQNVWAQTHSLYPPDDYTSFKSHNLDSFCFSWCHPSSYFIHLHFLWQIYLFFGFFSAFINAILPSFPPLLLSPFLPPFLPTISGIGSHTLNLLFLSEGGLFIKALSLPNTDLSITKLHLHTYCYLTPCAKYSFVKPSPILCLHLVEIVFFQPQALPSIQAGLGWHKQHTAVPLGKLIVKGSGWGFENALCYFYDSCRFFCRLIQCDQLHCCVPQQGGRDGKLMLDFKKFS